MPSRPGIEGHWPLEQTSDSLRDAVWSSLSRHISKKLSVPIHDPDAKYPTYYMGSSPPTPPGPRCARGTEKTLNL